MKIRKAVFSSEEAPYAENTRLLAEKNITFPPQKPENKQPIIGEMRVYHKSNKP